MIKNTFLAKGKFDCKEQSSFLYWAVNMFITVVKSGGLIRELVVMNSLLESASNGH